MPDSTLRRQSFGLRRRRLQVRILSRLDIIQSPRTVLLVRLPGRQSHRHRNAALLAVNRGRSAAQHGMDKLRHFLEIAVDVSLDEKVKRQITVNRFSSTNGDGVWKVVLRPNTPRTAKPLDSLIVAVDSATAVVDGANHSASELQHDQRRVDVSSQTD